MSDQPSSIPEAAPSEPARIKSPRRRRVDRIAVAYLIGFVILAGTLVYLSRHPAVQPTPAADLARDEEQIGTLQSQVAELSGRITQVEARPLPEPPPPPAPAPTVDLKPIENRIAALEARPVPAPTPPPAPTPAVDLKPLESRIAALEARPQPAPPSPAASPADLAALSGRVDQVATREDALSGRLTSETAAIGTRLDKVETRLAAAEHASGEIAGLTGAAKRLARLQAASAALDAGQMLGAIPGAPPALARFAAKPAPSVAELRLSYPAAAQAAHEASQPAITQGQPFLDRLWTRAQQAVTVREGTRVVLGDPISGVLAQAQQRLDAGDLTGAVQSLDGLAGPAAAAIKPWRDQAQALLDARAALAKLAADAEG
jgi:hypothetical protein